MRNQIEGVNRARDEALESGHHLFIAQMKGCMSASGYESLREECHGCVRMLNREP